MPKRRRGYPVAVLIGLGNDGAYLWDVYSESVKPGGTLTSAGSDYSLYEAVVDQLRPRVREGVKTIVVASEDRHLYQSFLVHVERHHAWLTRGWEMNTVTFTYLQGRAETAKEVRATAASSGFNLILRDASEGGLDAVMGVLEKRLNTPEGIDSLLLSLDDVEAGVYGEDPPEFILLTEGYARRHRSRVQRLTQVAGNRGIKTRTVPTDSLHAPRLEQLGGIVGMARARRPSRE
jgi:hypothetical protein